MRSCARTSAWWKGVFCLLSIFLVGCSKGPTNSSPQIVFSRVPAADVGGPEITDTIEGRVSPVRADQRIVLYAKSEGRWWVQPLVETPFTTIQGDSTWKNRTHLGAPGSSISGTVMMRSDYFTCKIQSLMHSMRFSSASRRVPSARTASASQQGLPRRHQYRHRVRSSRRCAPAALEQSR